MRLVWVIPPLLSSGIKLAVIPGVILPVSATADALVSSKVDASVAVDIVGTAYDISSGRLLYRELHLTPQLNSSGETLQQVNYQSPDGRIFAQKKLSYLPSQQGYRYHPQVQQINFDSGHLLRLAWRGDNPTRADSSMWQLQRRNQHKGPLDTLDLPSRRGWVVDAGFNAWILAHWSKLKTGKAQTFSFLALTRASWVTLRAKLRVCPADSVSTVSTEKPSKDRILTCITVAPQNPILRWLVDAIDLTYEEIPDVSRQGGGEPRLVRFSGLGNLTDNRGKGMKVVINYVYVEPQKLVYNSR